MSERGSELLATERAILLRGVPPFADLPEDQLCLLAEVVEERDIISGGTLFAAGTNGDHLYVLISGKIALEESRGTANSVARIATLGPGSVLGEDAVFDGGAHVLTATALAPCRLLTIQREALLGLLESQPALARSLIAWLSARLRETSSQLVDRTRPRPRSVLNLLDRIGEKD